MAETKETGASDDAAGGRLNRRLFFFKSMAGVATVAMTTTAVTVATTQPAEAQRCTDNDPNDAPGRGIRCRRVYRGCTDNDPNDAPGRGIRCRRVYRRSCSDADPYDPGGRGRRC